MSTPVIKPQANMPEASKPITPPTTSGTPRVARKAVGQPVAGHPLRQSPTQLSRTTSVASSRREEIAPSNISQCGNCKGAFSTTLAIRCLICSSANLPSDLPSICLICYADRAPLASHNHDPSFYASDSDPILPDPRLQQHSWIVRKNPSMRLWFEHSQTKHKTYIRPLTAVCELPSGWVQRKDPEGKIYYQHLTTLQSYRTIPGGLPSGWREAKDPDGKSFFVHDELQLASWHRPGEQPPTRKATVGGQPQTSGSAGSHTTAMVARPKPAPINNVAQVVANSSAAAVKQNGAALAAAVNAPSLPNVTLQTATDATVNFTEAAIVRNTKIATHIAHKGMTNTVKAVKNSESMQKVARETGLASANRSIKNAWKKASREVMESNKRALAMSYKGSQPSQPQKPAVQEVSDGSSNEYVIEYPDGTKEYYGADGQLRRTVKRANTIQASPSQPVSPGQQSSGQQQIQNAIHQTQSLQQNTQVSPSSPSSPDAKPGKTALGVFAHLVEDIVKAEIQEEIINVENQIIGAEQNFFADQGSFIDQSTQNQIIAAEQNLFNDLGTFVSQINQNQISNIQNQITAAQQGRIGDQNTFVNQDIQNQISNIQNQIIAAQQGLIVDQSNFVNQNFITVDSQLPMNMGIQQGFGMQQDVGVVDVCVIEDVQVGGVDVNVPVDVYAVVDLGTAQNM